MKKSLFLTLYFFSPLLLIGTLYTSNPLKYTNVSLLFTMILGSLGYTWLIWQFVFSARPQFIENAIGRRMLYRIHGIMAIVAILVSFVHNLINEELFGESFLTTLGTISLYTFAVVSLIALILMATPPELGRLKLIKWIKSKAQATKLIRYDLLKSFHNVSLIALIFMFMHVLNTSGAKTSILVFSVYTFYFIAALLFYLYHKIFKQLTV